MKYICKKPLKNVYTGFYQKHDSIKCTACNSGNPCQYEVEDEWYKLGPTIINHGETLELETEYPETVRLVNHKRITFDVKREDLKKHFKIVV